MKTRKLSALLLALVIAFGATSCKKEVEETTPSSETTVATVAETSEPVPETTETEPEPEEEVPSLYDPNNPLAINPVTGLQLMDPENVGKRSIAVVVNNCAAAMPQRGISQADAIYEYETEGGQTRLLCVFADVNTIPEIGSLRSARILSSDLAATNNSIFIHYGRNARVPDHIAQYGIDHIDGNNCSAGSYNSKNYDDGYVPLGGNLFFWRDSVWVSQRATEHTAVSDGRHIAEAIEHFGINPDWELEEGEEVPYLYNFVPDNSVDIANGNPCDNINVYFSATNDDAFFQYDPETKLYYKEQYGKPQIDQNNDKQIAVTNIIVLYASIEMNADHYTIDAYLQSGGCGYYVSQGKIIGINWEKPTPNDFITITNQDGEEVEVNRGKTYICVVDNDKQTMTTINIE